MPNNISVSITADVADLTAKRAVMSAELKAATKDLNDFARTAASSGMTSELRAGMLASAEAVGKAKNSISLLDAEMKKLKVDAAESGGVLGGFGKGLNSIKAGAESVSALRASVVGLGSAVAAAFAAEQIVGWAQKIGEAGEKAEHTAQILGTTVGDVQRVNAAFALTGVDADKGVLGMERLDKAFAAARQGSKMQTAAFQELGVSTTRNYTQMQLLAAVMEGFAKQADGPAKAAEAMNLFGRAGAALIPFLDLGAAGMATLNELTAKYGVVNEDAVAKSALLGEAFNENKVAMSGAGNVLAQELSPALTVAVQAVNDLIAAWVRSYNEGGDVKTILDAIDLALKELIAVAADLGIAFDETFQTIKLAVNGVKDALRLAADVARDTPESFAKIRGDMTTMANDAGMVWGKMTADGQAYLTFLNDLGDGHAKRAGLKPPGEGEGDTAGLLPKAAKGPDAVSVWAQQLHAQEIASGEFFRDQTQAELAFWQDKVARTTAGSKDWLAVQEKIFTAQKALARQGYNDQIATLNDQLEADHASWTKQQADWNAKLDFIRAHYGAESAEYKNAHREFERADRDHEQRVTQISHDAAQARLSDLRDALKTEHEIRQADLRTQEALIKEGAKHSANPFADVAAEQQIAQLQKQAIQEQIQALGQEYLAQSQITARELADAKAAMGEESQQYQKLVSEKTKLDNQYFNQRRVLVNQAANQEIAAQQRVQAAWHANIDPMVQAAGSALQGLVEGTMTWRQALTGIGQALIGVVITALERVAEQMIVNAIMAKTTQVATAQTGILASAAQAGAAGVASMAGAPFPIDLTAPAFGASMAATAAAFSVAGFAKGIDVVPQDMIAQIHAGERIVPAADNRALMSAVGAEGGPDRARRARDPLAMHFHLAPGMGRGEAERQSRMIVDVMTDAFRKDPKLRQMIARG